MCEGNNLSAKRIVCCFSFNLFANRMPTLARQQQNEEKSYISVVYDFSTWQTLISTFKSNGGSQQVKFTVSLCSVSVACSPRRCPEFGASEGIHNAKKKEYLSQSDVDALSSYRHKRKKRLFLVPAYHGMFYTARKKAKSVHAHHHLFIHIYFSKSHKLRNLRCACVRECVFFFLHSGINLKLIG